MACSDFWSCRAEVLARVADRAARLLLSRTILILAIDELGGRVLGHRGPLRHVDFAANLVRRVHEAGRSLSVPRVPRAQRPFVGHEPVSSYAAIPIRTRRGEVVAVLVALDPDPHEWDEAVLADLEETASWIFSDVFELVPAAGGLTEVA